MNPPQDRRSKEETEQRVQHSLKLCWKEGIAAQVMIGIMDYFLVPFALLLGATNPQVGLIVAVPNLLASIVPFATIGAVHRAGGRMRFLTVGIFVQAVFLLPIGLLSYWGAPARILVLTGLVAVYKTLIGMLGPAWGSLVSEYLPAHRRGYYFGWRARVVGLAGLANICLWGVFLHFWRRTDGEAIGFVLIFLAAGVSRLISLSFLTRMVELPARRTRESEFTFWMFLRRFRESNFVKFVLYVSSITFAAHLSAPYYSVHMLKDLKFSYLGYMAVSLAPVITSLLTFPIWGRHADQVGNAKILKITGMCVPIIPLLWLWPRTPEALFCIELFSGVVWGGFNLCVTNFIYDAVTPEKRVRCLSYFNFFNGLALFAGASLGGWLSTRLPVLWGHPLLSLFIVSAVARLLATLLLGRHFKEVRADTKHVTSAQLFFSVVGIRPIIGRNEEIPTLPPPEDARFGARPEKKVDAP